LHKFGSNVVEKCLEHSPQHKKELIVDRIVGVPVANHRITLVDLINSQYANYVVQRTFDISNQQRREILLKKIEQVLQSGKLVHNKHSKHVINHLQK
jgi:pumilio RNA-binding family